MQEQNFEQQVQKRLEELSLNPSPPVWDKVEEQIAKKKDKRRFVLWFLPLLLICSAITWWMVSTMQEPVNMAEKRVSETENTTQKQEQNNHTIPTIPPPLTDNKKNIQSEKTEANIGKSSLPLSQKNSYTTGVKMPGGKTDKQTVANTYPAVIKQQKASETTISSIANQTPLNAISKSNVEIASIAEANEISAATQSNETTQIPEEIKTQAPDTLIDQQPESNKPENKKLKKLQFGIVAHIGISGITSGLFDGLGEKSLSDFASPSPVQNGSGGGFLRPPSKIKRGISYAIGLNARKKVTNRSAFTAGLQYQYFSTTIKVGTRTDSTFGNVSMNTSRYYRNDNQSNDYANRYHFISLPISFEHQLLKKLPVHLTAGISLSRLISSNALHYNSATNIYYADNSLLNKNVAGLFTSLTYKLRTKKNLSIDVGPQFNYGVTPIQKNNVSKKQHLYSAGISTQIIF